MISLLWPTLIVQDVQESLRFYTEVLGFNEDFRLQDTNGLTFMGSVEVGDTIIMFEAPGKDGTAGKHGMNCGLALTILMSETDDIDRFYHALRAGGVEITCEIGDRYWGNRDFTIRDPDGYHLIFAKPLYPVSMDEIRAAANHIT